MAAVSGMPAAAPAEASADKAACNAPTEAARKALFGVAQEQPVEAEAVVRGELPGWLWGSLVVNGGGDYSHMNHMFDGYGLLAKVRVQGGRAWGAQRYVDSKAYRAYKREGRVVMREFATRPEVSGPLGELKELLGQLAGLVTKNPIFTDNASVSLQPVRRGAAAGGPLLMAMSETPPSSYIVDPSDLSTVEQVAYDDGLPGDLTTAHPSILADGSLLNFTRSLPFGGFHVYKQDPTTLQRTQLAFVPDRRPLSPAWLHDFAATDKYAVLLEQPLYMSLASLLLGSTASHLFMNWQPQDEVLVHVVPLDGSGLHLPTFFYFHVGNAFESADGSSLHVDLAAYDDPQILKDLLLQPLLRPARGADGTLQQQVSRSWYKRLTIPLQAGAAGRLQAPQPLMSEQEPSVAGSTPTEILGSFCEFPAINPANRSQQYRYGYCLSAVRPTNMGNALSKMDLQQGSALTWHEPGGVVGEPVFVARPGGAAEDDGVVLALVWMQQAGRLCW
ncbi:carotenoid oxygenase [Scenedesmus sp. NREL 46B-D3]|nr:carotenoid oxygenase [Scenedesmus sp. NREL 46B-D3]